MQPHILIVEDDPMLTKMLAFLLAEAGFTTTLLSDPRAVLPMLTDHAVDLLLLDVMLPHLDGFSLLPQVRHTAPDLPVIFLTARGTVRDTVEGFTHGADDYITKPFEPTELIVRVQAVLRRYQRSSRNTSDAVITVGEATLDLHELTFTTPRRPPVQLTPTEMKILECLMRHARAVVSREMLLKRVWDDTYEGMANRVDVTIRRLREKIEPEPTEPMFIHTVRGSGYVFRAPPQAQDGAHRLPG